MEVMANITILRLSLVVGAFISCAAWAEIKPVEMIVSLKSAKTVIVRAMPNQESNAIAFIENGKAILRKGSEETNGFVMVQLADGRTGWTKSAFLMPSVRSTIPEQPQVIVPPGAVSAPQGTVGVPSAAIAKSVMMQPQANQGAAGVANGKDLPIGWSLPQQPLSGGSAPLITKSSSMRQDGACKVSMELWIIGLVGMLIGLMIGGKAGMVYATKSIHERYVVI